MVIKPGRIRWVEYMTHAEEMKNDERHSNREKIKEELFLGDLDVEGNVSVTMHVRG
jgi:hypothetical protein